MLHLLYIIDQIWPTAVDALGLANMAVLTWRRYIGQRIRQASSMNIISRVVRLYLPLAICLLMIAWLIALVGWSATISWQQLQRPPHGDGTIINRTIIGGVIIMGTLVALVVQMRNIKRGVSRGL